MNSPWIAPSILAADFSRLGEEIQNVVSAGADLIHYDVMDNHYVPNLSVGPLVLQSLRKANLNCLFDVHLMVKPVDRLVEDFLDAKPEFISVHPETTEHLHRTLALIKTGGSKAGIVFNPSTPLTVLDEVLELVDLVLIMSVNPGFGGQSFIENTYDKVRELKTLINSKGASTKIEIDGGVNADNAPLLVEAGADVLVAGSFVFRSENPKETIAGLKQF